MGLETRACVNGLTKTDFENVKQIPALDDRITALEQGGSGGNDYSWSEPVTFESFSNLENVMNQYFEYIEEYDDYILKYDTIIVYDGYFKFVPKGFSYFDLSFSFSEIDNPISSNLRISAYNFNAQDFFFTEPQDDTKFLFKKFKWVISNPTDATFTFNNYSGEDLRILITFYFKNNQNNG